MTSPAYALEPNCGACGRAGAPVHRFVLQEKMYRLGDRFDYFECTHCGCLQIENPRIDLARYYPPRYYSFDAALSNTGLAASLERRRDEAAVSGRGLLGRLLLRAKPHPPLQALGLLRPTERARILDVGCGGGDLLRRLLRLGFSDLTGADPNIPADVAMSPQARIFRSGIEALTGSYDIVMFHHSLEHIPDQRAALGSARRLLATGGRCLVRIPLAGKHAWRAYGLDWVQLDAPRHLYLHTEASLSRLARDCGLSVRSIVYDSDDFQFWGSECLRQGIALVDPETGRRSAAAVAVLRAGRQAWRREAARLNARQDGDQAIFVLQAAP